MTALRSANDVYPLVDDLGPNAVGELVVAGDDGARGAIFIEGGRICWAAASGLAPRLTQLLVARSSVPPPAMESIFRSCKAERTPLGEHLIRIGALRPEDLRAALLQHTFESLGRLFASWACVTWCPRSGSGYSPKFTFTTAELMAYSGGQQHRSLAAEVVPILASSFAWAAAFVRTREVAYPVPIAVTGEELARTKPLLRFGKWATSALDVVAAFNDPSAIYVVRRGSANVVAFCHGAAIVAGKTDAHGPALILNRRARERRNADL